MSETEVLEKPAIETSPFRETSWAEKPIIEEKKEEPKSETPEVKVDIKEEKPAVVQQEVKVDEPKEEIFDEDKYVKDKWGWDNAEVGKKEVEALRERAKALDLTDEESRKDLSYIKEGKKKDLYNFLHQQEQVEKLVTSDLTNKSVAAELVKFSIGNKNKNLSPDEVDFLFNERFSIPSKPVQGDDLDEEYNPKVEAWKKQVENVEKRLVIEAKLAQPELEKLKTELVLPDIQKPVDTEAQQKELQRVEGLAKRYQETLESDFKKFNGYEIKYKDEEVEIPVSFTISDEEKISLKNELKDFDPIDFIGKRWFSEEGTPNITAIMDDMTLLRKKEVVLQKMVNEVGSKMR